MSRSWMLIVVDLVLVALATVFALILRDNFEFKPDEFKNFMPYMATTVAAAVAILHSRGQHLLVWRFAMLPDYLRLISSAVLIVICAVVATFSYNRLDGIARALPIIQVIFVAVALIGARVGYRLYRAHRTGRKQALVSDPVTGESIVLIIGLNPVTELFVNCARRYASKRIALCGIINERRGGTPGRSAFGLPVLGELDGLSEVLSRLEVHGITVNRIVITTDAERLGAEHRRDLMALSSQRGIDVDYFADRLDFVESSEPTAPTSFRKPHIAASASVATPLEALEQASARPFWRFKRVLDVMLASCLLIVTAPVLLAVGVATLTSMGAPILFWQYRPGVAGHRFKIYKFRSMRGSHAADGRRLSEGERASVAGSLLRLTRLDELPQLLSVVFGHMSFIGPRPLLLSDQAECPAARLLVRPGLTGWAQVNGGRQLNMNDKLALDLWYIRHASFYLDFQIACKTVAMMIHGERVDAAAIRTAHKEFTLDHAISNSASSDADGGAGHMREKLATASRLKSSSTLV